MSEKFAARNRVAIIGAGVTKVVRRANVPIGSLAVQASDLAIADAGLTRQQIDGVACGSSLPAYGSDRAWNQGVDVVGSDFLVEYMGLKADFILDDEAFSPALIYAAQAIASGAAKYVLVNRTLHTPPGRYNSFMESTASGERQWSAPYGYAAVTSSMALEYMEYQQRYGARQEHMATLVLQLRKNVQGMPKAYWYGKPLTFEDYMNSPMINDPMCLFDNDIPVDASGSFVLTSAERAKDSPHPPVYLTAWASPRQLNPSVPGAILPRMDDVYATGEDTARRLWGMSGWKPQDIDVVQPYDGFTPLVFQWLETLGFCPKGEAWQFIQDGRIDSRGKFPLLSGGGNQGWGRLHGVPHVLECYMQLSGRAGERQMKKAVTGLASYATPGIRQARVILFTSDPTA